MQQHVLTEQLDMHPAIQLISRLNPHITLSDIAFLMDVPYQNEPLAESNHQCEQMGLA